MANTRSTERVWAELTARALHPAGANLCRTLGGLHDDDGMGRCRDCGSTLAAGDDVANTGGGL